MLGFVSAHCADSAAGTTTSLYIVSMAVRDTQIKGTLPNPAGHLKHAWPMERHVCKQDRQVAPVAGHASPVIWPIHSRPGHPSNCVTAGPADETPLEF